MMNPTSPTTSIRPCSYGRMVSIIIVIMMIVGALRNGHASLGE